MSLFKRHIGRRVAGVGVGVALLVLGLEGPAFAAPTISAINPTSGPATCVVVITGTGFTEFPEAQTDVDFVSGATVVELDSIIISDTEIWATPEAAAVVSPGTSYNVRIVTPGTGATGVTSTATFLATSGAGGCAPTITDFKPTCGPAGTTVVITGTNLLEKDLTGGDVFFSPYDTATPAAPEAVHTVPDVDTPTSLSVIVPAGTTDGPIKVTTGVGSVFSTTSFLVPPPDCPTGGPTHARSISLSLRKHLVARGRVSSTEDPAFTDCVASVPVKIQRRRAGSWRTVGRTTTSDTGAYKKRVKDKPGKYRALAPKVTLTSGDVCSRAVSPVRRHRH
jgi:hypothetical protein